MTVLYWMIWNIPVSATQLPAALPVSKAELPDGSRQGSQNPRSNASPCYRGPCAPPSISHNYAYELFALDQKLDQPPGATRGAFLGATGRPYRGGCRPTIGITWFLAVSTSLSRFSDTGLLREGPHFREDEMSAVGRSDLSGSGLNRSPERVMPYRLRCEFPACNYWLAAIFERGGRFHFRAPASDPDQQAAAYTDRLLVPSSKAVVVSWFEKPAEFVLPGGPKHEVRHHFDAGCVCSHAVFARMNPQGTRACHELRFVGERPRLFEQEVGVPFC